MPGASPAQGARRRPAAGHSAAAGQPQQPVFRTRVDSVSVDVIVTDRQGQPVKDLKAADFEIREAGKPQTVETFRFIEIDDGLDDPLAQRADPVDDDQQRETAREDNRLFVIFLDDYHTRLGNCDGDPRSSLASWTRQLAPHDLVAVTLSADADHRHDVHAQPRRSRQHDDGLRGPQVRLHAEERDGGALRQHAARAGRAHAQRPDRSRR